MVKLSYIQSALSHHEYDRVDSPGARKNPRTNATKRPSIYSISLEPSSATPENHHSSELPPRILGLNRGVMKMSDDFDEPLPDEFWIGEE
jgi:hypothetical protein